MCCSTVTLHFIFRLMNQPLWFPSIITALPFNEYSHMFACKWSKLNEVIHEHVLPPATSADLQIYLNFYSWQHLLCSLVFGYWNSYQFTVMWWSLWLWMTTPCLHQWHCANLSLSHIWCVVTTILLCLLKRWKFDKPSLSF